MPQQNHRFRGLVPVEGLGCAAFAPTLAGVSSLPLSLRVGRVEHSRAQGVSQLQHRQHNVFINLLATASDFLLPPKLLHSLSTINSLSTGLQMVQCWSCGLAQAVVVWRAWGKRLCRLGMLSPLLTVLQL